MNDKLNIAIMIACKAHDGQTDKAGKPYVLHPLRLMLKFENMNEQLVAILHDVVEDSSITLDDLKKYAFDESVISAVDCLTKRPGEDYSSFLKRILPNNLARKVKVEDIKDNLNLARLNNLETQDLERIKKYHEALQLLEKII